MAFLSLSGLKKNFGTQPAVKEFDFTAEKGEFVSLLGPSGCGKTTVLRMVAGFETPSEGRITLDGRDITGLPPNQRNVGMVFQAYALFPNMTVAENIAFGLKVARRPAAEIRQRVEEMLTTIRLNQHAGKYPYQMSGGQQQRVALARALAVNPTMLLLDEPLSALDAKIRIALRDDIRNLQRKLGITTLFVTHDQEEALVMSDRIVVMSEGRIEQIGTPFDIYNHPRTRFVATFVGTLNFLDVVVSDPAGAASANGQPIQVGGGFPGHAAGDKVTLALRPEAIRIGPPGPRDNSLAATIDDVGFQGAVVRIKVRVGDNVLKLDSFNDPSTPPPERGTPVTVSFSRAMNVLDPE